MKFRNKAAQKLRNKAKTKTKIFTENRRKRAKALLNRSKRILKRLRNG